MMSRSSFITTLSPYAVQLRLEGSPIFPSVRLAQNLLETGGVIHSWNNLGGIKVGSGKPNPWWDGSSVRKGTWEVIDGQRIDTAANFRAYRSVYHFYKDQDLLFQLPRYARVRTAKTPHEQARMLYASGYATDPQYAAKLINLMNSYDLYKFDREVDTVLEQFEQLKAVIEQQSIQIKKLEEKQSMDIPEWAKKAVQAAVDADLVDTPDGGSYDFYRLITVLHRKGLLTTNS